MGIVDSPHRIITITVEVVDLEVAVVEAEEVGICTCIGPQYHLSYREQIALGAPQLLVCGVPRRDKIISLDAGPHGNESNVTCPNVQCR